MATPSLHALAHDKLHARASPFALHDLAHALHGVADTDSAFSRPGFEAGEMDGVVNKVYDVLLKLRNDSKDSKFVDPDLIEEQEKLLNLIKDHYAEFPDEYITWRKNFINQTWGFLLELSRYGYYQEDFNMDMRGAQDLSTETPGRGGGGGGGRGGGSGSGSGSGSGTQRKKWSDQGWECPKEMLPLYNMIIAVLEELTEAMQDKAPGTVLTAPLNLPPGVGSVVITVKKPGSRSYTTPAGNTSYKRHVPIIKMDFTDENGNSFGPDISKIHEEFNKQPGHKIRSRPMLCSFLAWLYFDYFTNSKRVGTKTWPKWFATDKRRAE